MVATERGPFTFAADDLTSDRIAIAAVYRDLYFNLVFFPRPLRGTVFPVQNLRYDVVFKGRRIRGEATEFTTATGGQLYIVAEASEGGANSSGRFRT